MHSDGSDVKSMKFNNILMTIDQNTQIRLIVPMYIEAKKQEYSIVDRKELPGNRIMIRIHRQYNKSPFPTTEGGEK